MNAYFAFAEQMSTKFKQRDARGNPPVYTNQERQTTEELRLKIIILCSIYVEALANLYLSIKLSSDQFLSIDRSEILAKWTSIPSLFLPDYTIPKGSALFSDLKTLIGQRNSIAHMKPQITKNGIITQEGNVPKRINIHAQIMRWDNLPGLLIDNLGKYDTSAEFMKFKILSAVDDYTEIRK